MCIIVGTMASIGKLSFFDPISARKPRFLSNVFNDLFLGMVLFVAIFQYYVYEDTSVRNVAVVLLLLSIRKLAI